ncbi:MAG: hypothetical protein ACMXYD_00855 [Candidatus Woesearchaeota archaeon]
MKRAQANTIDLLLAIMLMTTGVIIVTSFGLPQTQTPEIYVDARVAAEQLFSPYPASWNESTVVIPGIVTNHRLSEELFAQAQSIPLETYMGVQSRIYVNTTLGSIGTPPTQQAKQITALTRYAAYNATITPIEVIAWRE